MSQCHDTEFQRNKNWFGWIRFRAYNKKVTLTLVLAVAAIVIPVLTIGTLLSKRTRLLPELPMFIGTPSRSVNTRSAVLAVDTFGLTVRAKNASASTQKLFEQAAVEQLARLHQTYSDWADKNLELMGSLLLKLTVDATGTVVRVDPLASHVTNSSFTKTVMADVRKWRFPKGEVEPTEIMVPLLFVPKGMDPDTVVQWERKVRGVQGTVETPVAGPRVANQLRTATVGENTSQANRTHSSIQVRIPKPKEEVLVAFKTNRPVAIRENPRFSSKNVHEANGDTQLSVLENRGDWLKVKLADAGFIGFVRKEFVSPIN